MYRMCEFGKVMTSTNAKNGTPKTCGTAGHLKEHEAEQTTRCGDKQELGSETTKETASHQEAEQRNESKHLKAR